MPDYTYSFSNISQVREHQKTNSVFFMNHKDHDGVVPIMVTNPTGSGGRASTQMPNQQHMRHEKARMMFAIELN